MTTTLLELSLQSTNITLFLTVVYDIGQVIILISPIYLSYFLPCLILTWTCGDFDNFLTMSYTLPPKLK